MELNLATFESFSKQLDFVRSKRALLTNMFVDANKTKALIEEKICFSIHNEEAIILLIPYHNSYYDVLFTATNEIALQTITLQLQEIYVEEQLLRVSVVGKEPQTGAIADIFQSNGFILQKCIARMLAKLALATTVEAHEELIKDCQRFDNKEKISVALAREDQAVEILDLLLEEFDVCADNVPELSAIIDNIKKEQVVVVNYQGKVAALNYYELHKSILLSLFDVSRKEYRKLFLHMHVGPFINEHFIKNNIRITRAYGWRDIANKRLMKFAKLNNQLPDGIYIYNMTWDSRTEK